MSKFMKSLRSFYTVPQVLIQTLSGISIIPFFMQSPVQITDVTFVRHAEFFFFLASISFCSVLYI